MMIKITTILQSFTVKENNSSKYVKVFMKSLQGGLGGGGGGGGVDASLPQKL